MRHFPLLFALLLAACNGASEGPVFQGYVEGEFIQVAPEAGGRIVEMPVRRGDQVATGAVLFRIDAARRDFARQQTLFERRVVSEARLDQAREAVTVAEARLLEAERRREVAALPARTPEIEAAERMVQAAQAGLNQARTRLSRHAAHAPANGRIEDVYYEQGEVAAVGVPVLSLLPEGRRKVVFFVPEPARPGLAVGRRVSVSCDGCPTGLTAEVGFLASEAEFTPPVIYSRDTREKLVFRAEAALTGQAADLPLGQPVDVAPADLAVADGAPP